MAKEKPTYKVKVMTATGELALTYKTVYGIGELLQEIFESEDDTKVVISKEENKKKEDENW